MEDAAGSFACVPSGGGKQGDTCVNTNGATTCGEGLACLQLEGAASGRCTAYCTPGNTAHGCPTDSKCSNGKLKDHPIIIYVCVGT